MSFGVRLHKECLSYINTIYAYYICNKLVIRTRLDAIQEGGAEGGLLVLQSIEDFLGQVFLKQRLGVRGLELAESSLQFLNGCGVYHSCCFSVNIFLRLRFHTFVSINIIECKKMLTPLMLHTQLEYTFLMFKK